MITHPDFDRLRTFAAGEPSPCRRNRTAAHLARCGRCRRELAWVRGIRDVVRAAPEPAAPEQAWARIAERVRSGETVLLPTGEARGTRAGRPGLRRGLVRAAMLVLLVAGVASAVPGSPVRSWLARVRPVGATDSETDRARKVAAAGRDEAGPRTGVVVEPLDGGITIHIEGAAPALRIRVRLADDAGVEVRATGEAATARFRTGPGRLVIAGAGAGEIRVIVPYTVRSIALEVNGRLMLTKERDQIRVLAPAADTTGAEFVLPVVR